MNSTTILTATERRNLRARVQRCGNGAVCTKAEHAEWRCNFTNGDDQRDALYHWQSWHLECELLDGVRYLEVDAAGEFVARVCKRHGLDALAVRVVDPGEIRSSVQYPMAAFCIEERAVLLVRDPESEMDRWSTVTLLHEIAHALVTVHYGEGAQGVEHHGPEFVGVLCFLLADHFEVDVGTLLFSAAVDGELRVLPFNPAGTN